MPNILINNAVLNGSDIEVSISTLIEVESHTWMLREAILNSKSSSGHKSIEVETLSGARVLVQNTIGTYLPVPMNNDDIIYNTEIVYSVINASIAVSGIDINMVGNLQTAYLASQDYHTKRRILLSKLNDSSLSYIAKSAIYADYNNVPHTGLLVTIPNIVGSDWEFLESDGFSASYWSNGPYADIRLGVRTRQKLAF